MNQTHGNLGRRNGQLLNSCIYKFENGITLAVKHQWGKHIFLCLVGLRIKKVPNRGFSIFVNSNTIDLFLAIKPYFLTDSNINI